MPTTDSTDLEMRDPDVPACSGDVAALVVEDDGSVRELYLTALRGAGYKVDAAIDGVDALMRLEQWTPDVIVLDLALPRLSGRDLLWHLKQFRDTRDIPIVVVSGTDTSDLNADDCATVLHKPIGLEMLVKTVDDIVRGARRSGS